jgi:hypothetical protein
VTSFLESQPGPVSADRRIEQLDEDIARIDAALAKAKRARSKPRGKTGKDLADEALAKAFAKHGLEYDDFDPEDDA